MNKNKTKNLSKINIEELGWVKKKIKSLDKNSFENRKFYSKIRPGTESENKNKNNIIFNYPKKESENKEHKFHMKNHSNSLGKKKDFFYHQ